jgi:hypothetical protein
MNEPLLQRIRELEQSVRRWQLVSFALLLLVLSFFAISLTFGVVVVLRGDRWEDLERMHMEAQMERDRADQAMREAEVARQKLEEGLKKNPPAPPPD